MKTILAVAMVLGLAGTGWAESAWSDPNPCGSITTDVGRSPSEMAKMYREYHECMMGLADKPTGTITFTTNPCPESGPQHCEAEIILEPGYTARYKGRDVACLERMEAAMRAMERYREREDTWVTISDATSTITWPGYITLAPMPMCCDVPWQIEQPPPPPTLEEKIEALEQETTRKIREMKKAAAEAEEARGRRIVEKAHRQWAYQEWDAVKARCWRHP